jgi:hypothetical protein
MKIFSIKNLTTFLLIVKLQSTIFVIANEALHRMVFRAK